MLYCYYYSVRESDVLYSLIAGILMEHARQVCQYLYFCTRKASKLLPDVLYSLIAGILLEQCSPGTQFTCITGTKVQILTQNALQHDAPQVRVYTLTRRPPAESLRFSV